MGCTGKLRYVDSITSHVFFAIKHDESVAAMGFALLISFLTGVSVPDDANLARTINVSRSLGHQTIKGATYALNRAKSTKLALKVLIIGLVVKARNYQRLKGIASDVWIIVRVVYFVVSIEFSKHLMKQRVHLVGPWASSFSISSCFSRFLRSRASIQLSVGW